MLYWSDDGDLMALRYENWKAVFKEQRAEGFYVWSEPMVELRVPKIFNLRSDPFERADHDAIYYNDWLIRRVPAGTGPGLRRPVDLELQGVPAEPETGKLQHRPGHGEAGRPPARRIDSGARGAAPREQGSPSLLPRCRVQQGLSE